MAYTDVINDFSNGATGTLTDINGDTVGYSVSGTSPNTNWQSLVGGARVNGDGSQSFTLTFDDPVVGAAMRFSGSDATEAYYIEVNGATVDLNVLIANGDVTFTQSGAATHVIRTDGGLNGGHHSDGSIADFVFNFPVTSLGAYGSGANSGNWDFVEVGIESSSFDVVCFAQGTELAAPDGGIKVEDVKAGDVLNTFFGDQAVVKWVGSRDVPQAILRRHENLRPVRICAGALGQGLPVRDILVSRQHRVMLASPIVRRMFAVDRILVAAIKLVGFPGINVDSSLENVSYFHVLCEHHSILRAEGGPFESLLLGQLAKDIVGGPDAEADANNMSVPDAFRNTISQDPALAIASGRQLRKLLLRHRKNQQALFQLMTPFGQKGVAA